MLDNSTYKLLRELHELLENGVITQEEFAFKKKELLEKANTPVSMPVEDDSGQEQLSGTESQFNFAKWLGKNKWWVVAAIFSIAGLYTGWYFFIRHDPEKDAKNAAAAYCDCTEKNYERLAKNDEQFLKTFNGGNYYSSKQQARDKWYEIQNNGNAQSQDCFSNAEKTKSELRLRHRGKSGDIFDDAYNAETNNYKAKYYDRYNQLESSIYSKINAIKNPTPDAERIKSDLVGQRTQFWTFNYLSEIINANITNTTENSGRLELAVLLKLQSESNGAHDAEVIMVYLQDGENWTFNSVKMNYITYEYNISESNWTIFSRLSNYRFIYPSGLKLIWKICENCAEIYTGPDSEVNSIPGSTYYYVRSRNGTSLLSIKYLAN